MVSVADKKTRINNLLNKDEFEEILIKPITNPKGLIYLPKRYVGDEAIIIIDSKGKKRTKE